MLSLHSSIERTKEMRELRRVVTGNTNAFQQIILSLCKERTFNRIVFCQRYPVRVLTNDVEHRLDLISKCISGDNHKIPTLLSLLFESAVSTDSKKLKGQYFTPEYIADQAVKHLSLEKGVILDPGCGTGMFPVSILKYLAQQGQDSKKIVYIGVENDPFLALATAASLELNGAPETWGVLHADYLSPIIDQYLTERGLYPTAIISNPPYVRSNRLTEKERLKKALGISGHCGLHSFFVARSNMLLKSGKMIFVLPLEMEKAKYGTSQLNNMRNRFEIENKEIFYVDSKYVINDQSKLTLWTNKAEDAVARLVIFKTIEATNCVDHYDVQKSKLGMQHTLDEIAIVHRGISTGSNNFFVLTDKKAKELKLPHSFLKKIIPPAIRRVELSNIFTTNEWEKVRNNGTPCWLFYVKPDTPFDTLPLEVRQYVTSGERQGISSIYTCSKRKGGWHSIKLPNVPDIFFTYMYRDYPIFVYNEARALNLTNFIGVYLKNPKLKNSIEDIASKLNDEVKEWVKATSVGRKYAGGLINIGPGDLIKMPISQNLFRMCGNAYLCT